MLLCSLSVSSGVAVQVFGRLPDQEGAQPLSAAGVNTGSGVQPLPVQHRTAASLQVQLNCSSSQIALLQITLSQLHVVAGYMPC